MIDVINNIFIHNGFSEITIDHYDNEYQYKLFSVESNSMKSEYFITLELNNQSNEVALQFLNNKADDLFEKISSSGKVSKSFSKNCTIISCLDSNEVSREIILELEEDEYNFKKNIVAYTKNEIDSLKEYLVKNSVKKLSNEIISEIINYDNGEEFMRFKKSDLDIGSYYSLILKILHKLPFLTYIPQEKRLIDLDSKISNALSEYELEIYEKLINNNIDWTIENALDQVSKIWSLK